MSIDNICLFCNKSYNNKVNLHRHLQTNTCKASILNNQYELYNFIVSHTVKAINNYKECTINDNSINNSINNSNNNTNNVNIKIELQPISDISLKNEEALYSLIEKYFDIKQIKNEESFKNVKDVKFLLSDFLKQQFCNVEHPEKHCIKYINKYPPSYHISEKRNINGEVITTIRGFKDAIDLLSDPVLTALKKALGSFEKTLKKDTIKAIKNDKEDELKYDYPLYDTTIKALKNELNKSNVQAALKQFLKHDILNDINMKMTIITENLT